MNIITQTYHIVFTHPVLGSASGNPEIHAEYVASRALSAVKAEEEVAALPPTTAEIDEQVEKSSTVFPRDKTGLFAWDYQVRGFFKEASLALVELGDAPEGMTKWSCRKIIDTFVFVDPRRIYLIRPGVDVSALGDNANSILTPAQVWDKADRTNERPLRAQTMQGERIALARSEELAEGTQLIFTVKILAPGQVAVAKAAKAAEEAEEATEGSKPKAKKRKSSAVITIEHIENCLAYGAFKGFGQWRGGGWGVFSWNKVGTLQNAPA